MEGLESSQHLSQKIRIVGFAGFFERISQKDMFDRPW
jgi:hypothetical protein